MPRRTGPPLLQRRQLRRRIPHPPRRTHPLAALLPAPDAPPEGDLRPAASRKGALPAHLARNRRLGRYGPRRESLQILVRLFDRLALALVTDDRAHGDLKPENIIVGDDGTLCPIDFDASYLPAFAGEISPELGTAAYQHPARTAADFDDRIDSDPAYRETLALFEKRGMAVQYRIAQLLTAPTLRLFGLAELLAEAVREKPAARSGTEAETPELFVENGRWGYRTAERVVVAPLYDNGFDFTEGLAAVQLGGTWHYIDTAGRTRLSCPGCAAVKPFRGGKAQVVRNGERQEIAHPLKTPRYQ